MRQLEAPRRSDAAHAVKDALNAAGRSGPGHSRVIVGRHLVQRATATRKFYQLSVVAPVVDPSSEICIDEVGVLLVGIDFPKVSLVHNFSYLLEPLLAVVLHDDSLDAREYSRSAS